MLLFVKVSSSDWVWEDATVELILFGGRSSSTAWHNNIEQANMSHQFTRLCPILLTNYWHWHWPTTALSHIWNRRIVKIWNTHKFYNFTSHTLDKSWLYVLDFTDRQIHKMDFVSCDRKRKAKGNCKKYSFFFISRKPFLSQGRILR